MMPTLEPKDDHLALDVDSVVATEAALAKPSVTSQLDYTPDEEALLIPTGECRICQDEDHLQNLESPCTCTGSLKYAHRACVQQWCNEKGDTTCEICHETYKQGYTAPQRAIPDETTIDISDSWTITGSALDLRDPRILSIAQSHIYGAENFEYSSSNASGASYFRSAALFLLALLLLRHAVVLSEDDEDDPSVMISLLLLRAAGFFLPFYLMAWVFSIYKFRRERQEMAATEVAFILRGGVQFTIAPDSPTTPQNEP